MQLEAITEMSISEIQEAPCDQPIDQEYKREGLEELQGDKVEIEKLFEKLQLGFVPPFEYEMYPKGSCYLFGCTLHGHREYSEN